MCDSCIRPLATADQHSVRRREMPLVATPLRQPNSASLFCKAVSMRAASSAPLHRTRFAVDIAPAVLLLAAGAVSKSSMVSDIILALKIVRLRSSAKRCYSDYGICVSRQKSFKTTFFQTRNFEYEIDFGVRFRNSL